MKYSELSEKVTKTIDDMGLSSAEIPKDYFKNIAEKAEDGKDFLYRLSSLMDNLLRSVVFYYLSDEFFEYEKDRMKYRDLPKPIKNKLDDLGYSHAVSGHLVIAELLRGSDSLNDFLERMHDLMDHYEKMIEILRESPEFDPGNW